MQETNKQSNSHQKKKKKKRRQEWLESQAKPHYQKKTDLLI